MPCRVGRAHLTCLVASCCSDQGWGDVGYNCGTPGSVAYSRRNLTACPHTPHIDALATGPHSVLFHRFYSGAGVCSPTRASVLTGRNNKRGCINSALPCDHMATEADACSQGPGLAHSEFTVADAAAKVGYRTIHLGKVSVHGGGAALRPRCCWRLTLPVVRVRVGIMGLMIIKNR
jgi:arylsulfatase A-like enzyme